MTVRVQQKAVYEDKHEHEMPGGRARPSVQLSAANRLGRLTFWKSLFLKGTWRYQLGATPDTAVTTNAALSNSVRPSNPLFRLNVSQGDPS